MSTPVASGRQGQDQVGPAKYGVAGLFQSKLGEFKKDSRGDVAMLFGLMAISLMVFIGGAVDFGRWLHASKQTRNSVDAAVLAGARVLQLKGTGAQAIGDAKAAANKFYTENNKSRLTDVYQDTVVFDATADKTGFTATGNARIKTPVLALMGITSMPLLKPGTTEASVAKLRVGGNAEMSLEISMMLDTSGSMSGTKFTDMKLAAKDLIDIVVWDDQSAYTSKVSIAPFSADVRIPNSWKNQARGQNTGTKMIGNTKYNLSPCDVERTGAEKYTDAAPGPGQYITAEYTTSGNSGSGNCSQPADNEVMALSSNKTSLKAKVDSLDIGGGTAGHLGTAWAWYTLSPNWGSVFGNGSAPAAYGTAKLQKIAILMTDGEYNAQYNVEGISSNVQNSANGSSVDQAKALCDGMKQKGITVYTVGFDLGGNQTAINTLNYCATDATKFYNAADGSELRQAFRDIALKISDLYLSQ